MTTLQDMGTVPEWSIGDRLRKARTRTGMSVDEFAAQCLISAKSVNNYEGDKVTQRPLVVEKWSRVTGVDLNWLLYGTAGGPDSGPGRDPDPDPKPDGDALAKLTQSKLARSRHAGAGSTQRYPLAA